MLLNQEYLPPFVFSLAILSPGRGVIFHENLLTFQIIKPYFSDMQSGRQKKNWNLLVAGNRVFLGLIFLTGGLSKLMPFPNLMGPVWLEEELAKYGLGLFARFIACTQIITGVLLLTRRFALIGAILLFPMLINIMVITISLQWSGTPYVVAVFLLQNSILLINDYPKLKALISEDTGTLQLLQVKRKNIKADIMLLTGCTLLTTGAALYNSSFIGGIIIVGAGAGLLFMAAFNEFLFRKKKEL